MQLLTLFHALALISFLMICAQLIKQLCLKRFIIPTSLIAGTLALLFGPQALGSSISLHVQNTNIWINQDVIELWKLLPSFLITVVFASLFLGKDIPSLKTSFVKSLPNLGFGYTIAIGQYIVGMLMAIFILSPLFDVQQTAGALIAVGFQGGHGTVAGLKSTFEQLSFAQGVDLGLGIATIGLVSAIVFSTWMTNKVRASQSHSPSHEEAEPENDSFDAQAFTLQFAILALVISLAWLILHGMQQVESMVVSTETSGILKYMPLFPIAMLVGLFVQLFFNKMGCKKSVNKKSINALSNLSLDLLIVAALGSLDLSVIFEYWQTILILGASGVAYSLAVYFVLGSWFFNDEWKIRGLGELGQSMGTTAIGLLMLKQASSKPVQHIQPFSYKQPLYEPIVGGGIITALAIPAIASYGPVVFVWLMLALLLVIILGFYISKRKLR